MQSLVSVYDKENNDLLAALENIVTLYKEKNDNAIRIPISLFSSSNLGIMESTVKFLREEHNFNYSQIGLILNRDARTIWSIYRNCLEKKVIQTEKRDAIIMIPVSIFSDRKLSPLESLTFYLRGKDISLKAISKLLNRDYRAVWLSYKHASTKVLNKNEK